MKNFEGCNAMPELPSSEPKGVAFTHADYARLLSETVDQIASLSKNKGGEYAGDVDRLANFRRNGVDLDLPMEVIWRVYCAKHWDAIGQYIRDLQSGKERIRLEPIAGRVDDMIVYLILFKAMLVERGELKLKSVAPANPFVPSLRQRETYPPTAVDCPHDEDGNPVGPKQFCKPTLPDDYI